VQGDARLDAPCHQAGEPIGVAGKKPEERVEVEGLGAELDLIVGQRHLADRDLAGGAPRQHRCGPGGGEAVDRRIGDLVVRDEIAGAILVDAATLADPAITS